MFIGDSCPECEMGTMEFAVDELCGTEYIECDECSYSENLDED